MKEYPELPSAEPMRFELAPNVFMTVTFGGEAATISANGTHSVINKRGEWVLLISNQSKEAVTIAADVDGTPLTDSTKVPGNDKFVILPPNEVSRFVPPETTPKPHRQLFILGAAGNKFTERTIFFKHD